MKFCTFFSWYTISKVFLAILIVLPTKDEGDNYDVWK